MKRPKQALTKQSLILQKRNVAILSKAIQECGGHIDTLLDSNLTLQDFLSSCALNGVYLDAYVIKHGVNLPSTEHAA